MSVLMKNGGIVGKILDRSGNILKFIESSKDLEIRIRHGG
jgi:hypothetical protein